MSGTRDGDKPVRQQDVAFGWWGGLQDVNAAGAQNHGADRATLARLRRADADTVLLCEPIHRLYHLLRPEGAYSGAVLRNAADFARVASHVDRHDGSRRLGAQLGPEAPGGRPRLSRARFGEIVTCNDREDLVRCLRRAVDVIGNVANVRDLGTLLLFWNEVSVTRLAHDYYSGGSAAPATSPVPATAAA